MNVMVTGGAGYIGSHAVKRLLAEGHRVVVVDNLCRGHIEAIDALMEKAGGDEGGDGGGEGGRLVFSRTDTGEMSVIESLLCEHRIDTVMHFAALTYVGESVTEPLAYYRNNTACALSLLEACDASGVERFIFSSTCATYGEPAAEHIPLTETVPQSPISPYGMSKLHMEHQLADYAEACRRNGRSFGYAALRYFNVAGSDPEGLIGEDHDPETHIIPVVIQAVLGLRKSVTIFGTDYDTPDGTCIRDYIHVEDLIDAHVRVMGELKPGDERAYNLGIGKGYSVREIIESVKRVTGCELIVREGGRRPGDPPRLFANPAKIKRELGWEAKHTDIDGIVATAWNWFEKHPHGYAP